MGTKLGDGRRRIRAAFFVQQVVGWSTYSAALEQAVRLDPEIEPTWVPITYERQGGFIERLSWLTPHFRGALRGVSDVAAVLLRKEIDAAFFNAPWLAAPFAHLARHVPRTVVMDMTPHQFDAAAELYNHRPDRRGPAAVIKHHLTVQTLRRSAKLIATSRWVVDSLTADYGIAESSVEVIPHGVEVEAWRPTNRIEPNPPIILFVGGDFHRKGGELLLQWFCSRGRGRCELHIVSADAPARILDEAGVHVHRDLRANSPELKRLFWDSSIFCLPSRDEPFGIACVEALAAGLPAVVTRVGGLQEIVDDGSTGLAVSPGDGEALGAALERLLDSRPLRLAMGQAAQQAASQRFDSRVNMRRTLDVLKGTVRLRGTQRAMQSHRIA